MARESGLLESDCEGREALLLLLLLRRNLLANFEDMPASGFVRVRGRKIDGRKELLVGLDCSSL